MSPFARAKPSKPDVLCDPCRQITIPLEPASKWLMTSDSLASPVARVEGVTDGVWNIVTRDTGEARWRRTRLGLTKSDHRGRVSILTFKLFNFAPRHLTLTPHAESCVPAASIAGNGLLVACALWKKRVTRKCEFFQQDPWRSDSS